MRRYCVKDKTFVFVRLLFKMKRVCSGWVDSVELLKVLAATLPRETRHRACNRFSPKEENLPMVEQLTGIYKPVKQRPDVVISWMFVYANVKT